MPSNPTELTVPGGAEQTDVIETLRQLEANATPAPWKHNGYNGWLATPDLGVIARFFSGMGENYDRAQENGALIAAMRNALPDLLSRLASLSSELDRVRGALTDARAAVRRMHARECICVVCEDDRAVALGKTRPTPPSHP